ncbi:MAG: hypothetical protein ABFS35_11760 [Bacteroidota bacterium]
MITNLIQKKFLLLSIIFLLVNCKTEEFTRTGVNNRDDLLKPAFHNSYKVIIKEPKFKNLKMLGTVKKTGVYGKRMYGQILRGLRFQNITKKVEEKYHLPENLLLAMIIQESGGVDLLPNSIDDGGIGLIHMQPSLARKFGLKTYENCDKLVCKKHGKEIRQLIKKNNYDRKKLISYDDRFHPILNIDAAARMLVYYKMGYKTKDTPIKTAIYGYAGPYNYKKYYKNVSFYMQKLNDENLIDEIRNDFNMQNENLKINNKKGDFDLYIEAHQKQNINYGLKKYK